MSYIGNQPSTQSYLTDQFSGNGSNLTFNMSVAPASASAMLVAIFGILQDPSTYGVNGKILTFSSAPPTGTNNISVRYLSLPSSAVANTAYRSVTDITATAGQTTFSVASYTPGFIDVFRNGAKLGASDFTATNGAQVVLNNATAAGDLIQTVGFYVSSVLNAIPATSGAINSTYIGAGAVGAVQLDVSGGSSGTGAMTIPIGTTAQRPSSPTNGMIRKNTTTGYIEFWDPSTAGWIGLGAFQATGGTMSQSGGYQYHVFTSSASLTVISGARTVDYLIVAGGGGGAGGAGGGGAGGYRSGTVALTQQIYSVIIGNGGSGSGWPTDGITGGDSSAFGITATGGGGGSHGGNGLPGGSGGGGGYGGVGGSGTAGQGNRGGDGINAANGYPGGGGGGASAAGANASGQNAGNGGAGSLWLNGSYYAGGGGGNTRTAASSGTGGIGGGGNGTTGGNGSPGTANTGGGGGAGATTGAGFSGGNGGSGIVIIRYAI